MNKTVACLAAFGACTALLASFSFGDDEAKTKDADTKDGARPERVMKTDAEWARILTPAQFAVTRRKATEPAFSGKYVHSKIPGTFTCVCCGNELFSSKAKFESGTGWPSFWRPIDPKHIATAPDYSAAEPRIEVECRTCGAHLGHVFNDGPPPTGLRYCINSLSLKLVPSSATKKDTKTQKSTTRKTKGRSTTKSKGKPAQDETRAADSSSNSNSDSAPTNDAPASGSADAPAAKSAPR